MENCLETIHALAANQQGAMRLVIAAVVAELIATMAVTMAVTEITVIAVMTGTTGIETVIGTVIEIGIVIATGIGTETATGIEIADARSPGLGRAHAKGEMTAVGAMTGEGQGTTIRMMRMTGTGTGTGTEIGTKKRIDEPLMMVLGGLRRVLLQGAMRIRHGRAARSNGEEGSNHTPQHIRKHMTNHMVKRLVNGMDSSHPPLVFHHGIINNGLGHHQLLPRGSGRRRPNSGLRLHLINSGHNTRLSSGDPEEIFMGKSWIKRDRKSVV